jgi:hypothetical protein
MRKKQTILILVILIIVAVYYLRNNFTGKIKLESPTTIKKTTKTDLVEKIIIGNFVEPKFCNSNKVVYTNKEGNKLFLKNLVNGKVSTLLKINGLHNNFGWDKNCENVIFKIKNKKYETFFNSINILNKNVTRIENIPELTSVSSLSVSDTIFFLDKKNLQIKAKYKGKTWKITNDDNKYYSILISPNGKKMVAHSGANIFIFNLNTKKVDLLGKGIITEWHKDSKYLIGFLDESKDGHSISNSEIYLYDSETLKSKKITNTIDYFEAFPNFIDSNTIGYSDLKKGDIYKKEIKIKI